jgi:hypothetical protein
MYGVHIFFASRAVEEKKDGRKSKRENSGDKLVRNQAK